MQIQLNTKHEEKLAEAEAEKANAEKIDAAKSGKMLTV